jgi:DNA-binding MarR family transcriptional regulator
VAAKLDRELELDEELARRIGRAWRELRRGAAMAVVRQRIYGEDLELGQTDALDVLVLHGPCRMGEVADALRVDASTATRAVARLVDAGLAQRTPAPGDARGVLVAATRKGRAVHDRFSTRARAAMREILSQVGDREEQQRMAEGLERLVEAVDSYAGVTSAYRS